jgi:stage V sporulation protein G
MRLLEGRKRRYVAMPARHTPAGGTFEVYHPINKETRETLERLVMEGFEKRMSGEPDDAMSPVPLGSGCDEFVITAVRVRPFEDLKLRGFASLVIDDCLAVNGIKMIETNERRFVQMPNVRKRNGKYRDLAFPTKPEIRQMIEESIFEEYKRVLDEEQA